jgi:hypothetical protein
LPGDVDIGSLITADATDRRRQVTLLDPGFTYGRGHLVIKCVT